MQAKYNDRYMKKSAALVAEPPTRRQFDRQEALETAMKLFWEHGYEATSMSMLLKAMGLTAPSLYAAYGNKEKLFQEAVALYGKVYGAKLLAPLLEGRGTARAAIENVLRISADLVSSPGNPSGCLISFGALKTADPNGPIPRLLRGLRIEIERQFRSRLERAVQDQELPADVDVPRLARFYYGMLSAIQLRSLDGAPRAELRALAEDSMAAWPSKR